MIKKVILLMFSMILSLPSFATTWKYEGGLDGEAGLMVVYKTLPPLIVEVEQPEIMVVPRGKQTFKYTEVTEGKKPLNVKIKVQFNSSVVEGGKNGVNKEIIRTIYDTAKLSFLDDGKFFLTRNDALKPPRKDMKKLDINNRIDGEVFFTNNSGIIEGNGNGKVITRKLSDNINNGLLSRQDIYIDAEFNKEKKEMLSGTYSGTVILQIEFLGKGVN